jgi:DNA-binding MarR family transcriptional regulator
MTHQSMGELVHTLEQRGYLERGTDPSDGRAKLVRLTPKGRRAVRHAIEEIAQIEAEWLKRYNQAGFDVNVPALLESGLRHHERSDRLTATHDRGQAA